jgi:hypothetical protein
MVLAVVVSFACGLVNLRRSAEEAVKKQQQIIARMEGR